LYPRNWFYRPGLEKFKTAKKILVEFDTMGIGNQRIGETKALDFIWSGSVGLECL
jgi:hypothetical protein